MNASLIDDLAFHTADCELCESDKKCSIWTAIVNNMAKSRGLRLCRLADLDKVEALVRELKANLERYQRDRRRGRY